MASPNVIQIVRRDTRWDEYCFDVGSPFTDVTHAGKLENTATDARYIAKRPPFNHCVVDIVDGSLGVIRFTPFRTAHLNRHGRNLIRNQGAFELANVLPTPDDAIEMHMRHLAKLGQLGLRPWLREIRSGTATDIAPTLGIFTLQDVLPEGHQTGLYGTDYHAVVAQAATAYRKWAESNNEPGYLYDIGSSPQFSIVEGELVLHDVEPLYASLS